MERNPTPKICPLLTIACGPAHDKHGRHFEPCIQDACELWVERAGCELTFFSAIHEALDCLKNKF